MPNATVQCVWLAMLTRAKWPCKRQLGKSSVLCDATIVAGTGVLPARTQIVNAVVVSAFGLRCITRKKK